ncbi:MAG: ECF transporter S component [Clostridia bacterium]|nr:ECF transporter S component [Clostridia bacterium]
MHSNSKKRTLRLAQMAMLIALIAVLQILATVFSKMVALPVSITLTLVPIVVGAVLFGPLAGAILGFSFGVIVLITGFTGFDPVTLQSLQFSAVGTSFLVLVKGAAAGAVAGAIAIPFKKKQKMYPAVFSAAILAPLTNTTIYIIGMMTIFQGTWLADADKTGGVFVTALLIIGMAIVNFIIELIINIVLAPSAVRIIEAVKKSKLV